MQPIAFKPHFAGEDKWGFEIMDGLYAGTVVQIMKLDFVEGGNGNCQLEFHIIKRPDSLSEEAYKTEDFNLAIQSIITEIIKLAVDAAQKEQDENRNSDPPESDPR